jgi:signal transduction histidine kinase
MPDEPMLVKADRVRLSQALQNLICNATKYMDPGGTVRMRITRDGESAVITVSDGGIGIAADELDSIFDLYAQAPSATERCAGGLGIGLYVAREIIRAHGGTIRAASAGPGQGSEFTVRLPRGATASELPARTDRQELSYG